MQIVDGLRTHLVEDAIVPGDVLPSVRRLAADLGVHFNTVAQAYRELAVEGWVDVSHGKPVKVVARRQPAPANTVDVGRFRDRIRSLISEARAQGIGSQVILRELNEIAGGLR